LTKGTDKMLYCKYNGIEIYFTGCEFTAIKNGEKFTGATCSDVMDWIDGARA
jgi:hypothetical protein